MLSNFPNKIMALTVVRNRDVKGVRIDRKLLHWTE